MTNKTTPFLMVECKLNDRDVDRSLVYLKNIFPDANAWQISLNGSRDYRNRQGIRVAPAVVLSGGLV